MAGMYGYPTEPEEDLGADKCAEMAVRDGRDMDEAIECYDSGNCHFGCENCPRKWDELDDCEDGCGPIEEEGQEEYPDQDVSLPIDFLETGMFDLRRYNFHTGRVE